MRNRHPLGGFGFVLALLWASQAVPAEPAATVPQEPTSAPAVEAMPYVPPSLTRVTPFVGGRTLTWTAFDQLATDGTVGPDWATSLRGVAGGTMGIVETGTDNAAGTAASWRSTDGGHSWTESLVPGAKAFGTMAAHGGV